MPEIKLDSRFKLQYTIQRDGRYHLGKKCRLIIIDEEKSGDKRVLQTDNYDPNTGNWPIHRHKPEHQHKKKKFIIGSSWNEIKEEFFKKAIDIIGRKYEDKLHEELEKIG